MDVSNETAIPDDHETEDTCDNEVLEEALVNKVHFVSCLKWIQKSVAKAEPEKIKLSKKELMKLTTADDFSDEENDTEMAGESSDEENTNQNDSNNSESETSDIEHEGGEKSDCLPENGTENNSDNDSESDNDEKGQSALGHIATYENMEEDANLSSDADSDKEDDIIKPNDNLLLVGRVEEDFNNLEVYIYNDEDASFYCHHHYMLDSFPLCLEWLNHEAGERPGNYCAIGYLDPIIEIWDLDIMNAIMPAYKLGRKPSKGKSRVGHTDAILNLAWNKQYNHILASASADKSVILWDLDELEPSETINVFKDKVQSIEWHPLEGQTLLAGGVDRKVRIFDCRSIDKHLKWSVEGETEIVTWCPTDPYKFYAGTNNGLLYCFDCRKGELWSIDAAQGQEITGITESRYCPGLLVTVAVNGAMAVWDTQMNCDSEETFQPTCVHRTKKRSRTGRLHCTEASPDHPYIFAIGGEMKTSNGIDVFNIMKNKSINQVFSTRPLKKMEVRNESNSNHTNDTEAKNTKSKKKKK